MAVNIPNWNCVQQDLNDPCRVAQWLWKSSSRAAHVLSVKPSLLLATAQFPCPRTPIPCSVSEPHSLGSAHKLHQSRLLCIQPFPSFSWALKKIIFIFSFPPRTHLGKDKPPSCISTSNILHPSHPQLLMGNEAVILFLIAFRMHNTAQDCKGLFIK